MGKEINIPIKVATEGTEELLSILERIEAATEQLQSASALMGEFDEGAAIERITELEMQLDEEKEKNEDLQSEVNELAELLSALTEGDTNQEDSNA